ncbi:MAG: FtsX-like permease family protein [Pseudomonadota bacterium]
MLKFSLTMTMRDWRAGELRFLLVALALAVASLSAVQFFAERMGAALQRDAHQLLAADLRLSSDAPLAPIWGDEARRRGLHSASTVELTSMAIAGDGEAARSQMVEVKAVSSAYPLRGALSARDRSGRATPTREVPAAGSAWVDQALLASLNLELGASLRLGEQRLTITRAIASEPDRGPAALDFSPRVMIALADLDASGLIQGNSLASFHLLLAGDAPALAAFQAWTTEALAASANNKVRLETLASSNADTGRALAQADRFLSLIGLLSAMLASVAVAMAARRFMLRHADACAMLRCLGMPNARVSAMFMVEFLVVGLVASAIGVLLGFGAHFLLLAWLGDLVAGGLAPASWAPALRGMAVGVLLLAGFALPPLLQLKDIPHNRLLRGDTGTPRARTMAAYVLGLGMFGVLLVWQSGGLLVGLLSAAAFVAGLLLFAAIAWAAIASLSFMPAALERGVWRLALADLRRRPGAVVTQVVALALGLMALLLLTLVRGDLLDAWKNTVPAGGPNHIVLNIEPAQRAVVAARMQPFGQPELRPLYLGRLVAINGKAPGTAALEGERAKRMIEREIEMSASAALPAANTLLAGRWFSGTAPQLSVTEGSAEALKLKVGDRVTLEFAGSPMTVTVTSIRKIERAGRMSAFPFLLNPAAAQDLSATYVTMLHVPVADTAFMNRLVQDYPNLRVFDVGALVRQLQRLLDQVSTAIEFLFLFTLASGVLVLYATLMSSQAERMRQAAVLRALGASRAQLARAQWIEYALTGAIAGLLAAAGASVAGWALARFAFRLEWQFSPVLMLAGVAAGAACAMLGGWAGLRAILKQSPLHSLRTN